MNAKSLTFALSIGVILILVFGLAATCSGSGHHHHTTKVVHVHQDKPGKSPKSLTIKKTPKPKKTRRPSH